MYYYEIVNSKIGDGTPERIAIRICVDTIKLLHEELTDMIKPHNGYNNFYTVCVTPKQYITRHALLNSDIVYRTDNHGLHFIRVGMVNNHDTN